MNILEFIETKKHYNQIIASIEEMYLLKKDGSVESCRGAVFLRRLLKMSYIDGEIEDISDIEEVRIIYDAWYGGVLQQFLKPIEDKFKVVYYARRRLI